MVRALLRCLPVILSFPLTKASSGHEQQEKRPDLGGQRARDAGASISTYPQPYGSFNSAAFVLKLRSATQYYSHLGLIIAGQVSPQALCNRNPPLVLRFNVKLVLASQYFNYSSARGSINSSSILKIILAPITAPILHHLPAKRVRNH